jgi:hypothetical protein
MYSSNFLSKGTYDQYNDPALVYYSADIINNQQTLATATTTNRDAPARFQESRATPILNNASNFEVAVVSANLDGATKSLPIFIPQIDLKQTNPDKTIYRILLTYDTQSYSSQIIFTSPSLTSRPSNIDPLFPDQDLSTDYYYIYNYQQFIDIINNNIYLLSLSFTTPPIANAIPYLSYDPNNGLFSIYMPITDSRVPKFGLYFNEDLYNLFSSFSYNISSLNPDTPYQLSFYSATTQAGLNEFKNTYTNVLFKYITQQYNTTNNMWCPISSIVFSTTLLPILNESTSSPIVYKTSNINNLSTSSNAFNNNILEFNPITDKASDITNILQYLPSAEFRYKSLTGSNTPINNIDINLYWRNRLNNQLYQLFMPNNSNISIKLLFRRKN